MHMLMLLGMLRGLCCLSGSWSRVGEDRKIQSAECEQCDPVSWNTKHVASSIVGCDSRTKIEAVLYPMMLRVARWTALKLASD